MWVTVREFADVFDVCPMPEIVREVGHRNDLENIRIDFKELNGDLVSSSMAKFLFGRNSVSWTLKTLLHSDAFEIEEFVSNMYCDKDKRFDNIRINLSSKSIKNIIKRLKIARSDITRDLIFGLSDEELKDLYIYLGFKDKDMLPSRAVNKIVRLPSVRFYNALHQIIRAGLRK